jgi:hypothetical protein
MDNSDIFEVLRGHNPRRKSMAVVRDEMALSTVCVEDHIDRNMVQPAGVFGIHVGVCGLYTCGSEWSFVLAGNGAGMAG